MYWDWEPKCVMLESLVTYLWFNANRMGCDAARVYEQAMRLLGARCQCYRLLQHSNCKRKSRGKHTPVSFSKDFHPNIHCIC